MFSLTKDSIYPGSVTGAFEDVLEYAPGTPQFRQLNSFYAASQLRDRLNLIGVSMGSLPRIDIDAHCRVSDNAYYSPSTNSLCLGYADVSPSKRIWAADDSDVIIHEAGHAVNHALASTAILNSTGEAKAIDESIADYWALTTQGNARLSEWFLGYLGGMRDADNNNPYPASLTSESHADSKLLTQTLWRLRTGLGVADSDAIVARALTMLPQVARFGDFYLSYYDAAKLHYGAADDNDPKLTLIRQEFMNRGIHRNDAPVGIAPAASPAQDVYVIDDHTLAAQAGGNCDGVLDVGETALVLVNLSNPGAELGAGVGVLAAPPPGIVVPSGGNLAEFFRMGAGQTFVSSLPAGRTREGATIAAAFLLTGEESGPQALTFEYRPMFADPLGAPSPAGSFVVNINLNIGTSPVRSACANGALWP